MNSGFVPALSNAKTMIMADKPGTMPVLSTGIRLSKAGYVRYRHNDLQHLTQLFRYITGQRIYPAHLVVVTESNSVWMGMKQI
ncbi:hypothetical protein [Acinetobacter lwoffii]|uniref:hypothetical protein n=1 Tax=Acinetobacter lwoffii TaxID=28090 RepID=UPI001E5AC31B|nr:hypothetical protein [Acinetobacter lwoffii]